MSKIFRFLIIFLIITSWIFSGWPQIWQNPPTPLNKYLTGSFPPRVQETLATFYATSTPGANGIWTVPANVGEITIYAWGGGGGSSGGGNNANGGAGGGGGFASTTVSVSAGITITLKVGGGGGPGSADTGGTNQGGGGGGGGYTSATTSVATYIIAGGGGGGGSGADANETGGPGGAGGGTTGVDGSRGGNAATCNTDQAGQLGGGGSASGGGSAGQGCASSANDGEAGEADGIREGGDGGSTGTNTLGGAGGINGGGAGGNADDTGDHSGAGGGGGGYYGGGGGEAGADEAAGGGGGGSGYISGSDALAQGSGVNPGKNTDSVYTNYCSGKGVGGAAVIKDLVGNSGTSGCIVIFYNSIPNFNGGSAPTESSDPVDYGSTVTFSATAGDRDNDPWYLAVCGAGGVTANSGAAPACNGTSYCVSSSAVASSTQNTCQWTANTVGTINWQGFAVDATTTPNIATTSPANITNSPLTVKGTLTLANEGGGSPYLYIFDGNNYQFVSDFIPGAENKINEKEDYINISGAYIDKGKIKLKITEEMDEIAYLDQIYLLLDGKTKINPDDGLSYISKFINRIIGWIYGFFDAEKIINHDDGLSYLSKSDDKYLVVKKGDEYYLEFNLPKNYLNNLTKIEFIVEGYYIKISSANDEWILYKRDREADVYQSTKDPAKFQARISSAPINYWDGQEFQPINLAIKESDAEDFKYEMSAAPYQVYFPEHLISPIKLTNKEHSYQFSLKEMEGASPSQTSAATINDHKVIYLEAFKNIDIEYTLRKWGIKEFFILKERPKNDEQNGATLDFVDSVDIGDLKMYLDGQPAPENFITDKSIEFVDEKTKTTIFRLPTPYAVDANDQMIQTQYKIKTKGDEILVYNQTSYEWLNASERVYPIKIDASPETITAGWDIVVVEGGWGGVTATTLNIGMATFNLNRTGIDFNTSVIPDSATISQVDFKFYISSNNASANLDADEMTGGDSTDGAAKNYYDANDINGFLDDVVGASYLSGDTSPQSTGLKQVALLSQANTDLQNQLSNNWFSIGLTETGEQNGQRFSIYSLDNGSNEPQIIVTYTSGPGQITDQFESDTATTTELFRFRLTPNYENASTTLTLDLSSITGIVSDDITSGAIYVDSDVDGRISAGETAAAFGCGSPNISGASGTITCNATSTLTMSTNYEYIYKATVSNLAANDTITFGLSSSKIIAIGNSSLTYNSKLTVSGSADNATHTADAAESLTLIVTTDDFPALTPGTPRFATSTISVDTNSSNGWYVTLEREDADTTLDLSTDGTVNITDKTEWIAGNSTTTESGQPSTTITSGQDFLAFRVMTASSTNGAMFFSPTWWGSDDTFFTNAKWAGIASSTATTANKKIGISSVSSGGSPALNTALYYLDVSSNQKTGTYSGNIIFTAVMN